MASTRFQDLSPCRRRAGIGRRCYSESLDHELRTRGIRVAVIEPAYTKTKFDTNLLEPDSRLDEYREARATLSKVLKEVMATGDGPSVVADVVPKAASSHTSNSPAPVHGRAGRPFDIARTSTVR